MAVADTARRGSAAGQLAALVEAQFRSLFHFYSRGGKVGSVITGVMSLAWYLMIAAGSVAAGAFCARASEALQPALATGALFVMIYWQFIPLMLVSTGVGLDLKRLVVYPLSRGQFYVMDLALRVTTGVEALMLVTGTFVGLVMNPRLALWAPLAMVPFVALNLGLASGLRAVFGRWMTGRRTRELTMLFMVMLATLPRMLLSGPRGRRLGLESGWSALSWSPWALMAEWASGKTTLAGVVALFAWTGAAGWFAWWQLGRTLRDDGAEAAAVGKATGQRGSGLFAWLTRVMGDPMAALVEKEMRSLARTPRFRVVFIMGFSFSLMLWLPSMASRGDSSGMPSSFLTLMMGYALLLLGESCFWNTLGFDRGAAQFYFLAPMPFRAVLQAKNMVAGVVAALELAAITTVALVLRLPVTPGRVAEAASAGVVTTMLLLAAGNIGSVYAPRATDPTNVWRKASAGKTQAVALFASPLLAAPVLLAYLARYAADAEWAFWAVMALMSVVAGVVYNVALDSAVKAAMAKREEITAVLSAGSGPVTG